MGCTVALEDCTAIPARIAIQIRVSLEDLQRSVVMWKQFDGRSGTASRGGIGVHAAQARLDEKVFAGGAHARNLHSIPAPDKPRPGSQEDKLGAAAANEPGSRRIPSVSVHFSGLQRDGD